MTIVRVTIPEKDSKISAMVKALAFATAGHRAVRGVSDKLLESKGSLDFPFKYSFRANEFRDTVAKYLPGRYATAEIVT